MRVMIWVRVVVLSFLLLVICQPLFAQVEGLVSVASNYSVERTIDRLDSIARAKGLKIFTRIDFTEDAREAGLKMHPAQLLIFGNPQAGTPLMLSAPTIAIDLPLKALAWQDSDGKVWLCYNDPAYLQKRHHFNADLLKNISGMAGLMKAAAR